MVDWYEKNLGTDLVFVVNDKPPAYVSHLKAHTSPKISQNGFFENGYS